MCPVRSAEWHDRITGILGLAASVPGGAEGSYFGFGLV